MSKITIFPVWCRRLAMKTAEIKELIAIFNESDITELVLELDNLKLHLSKLKVSAPQQAAQHVPQPSATAGTKEAEPQQPSQEQPAKLREVLAPMVGVFYRAPSPGGRPVCGSGLICGKGPDSLHHRSNEADERDRVRIPRPSCGDSGGKRAAGGVRPALVPD